MEFYKLFKHPQKGKALRHFFNAKAQGKADGGALFVVTTCLSIICLGLAFVGGNIPDKFPKSNPRGAEAGGIVGTSSQNTLQLLSFKALPPVLIPTIDPKAPPLSSDRPIQQPGGSGGAGATTGPGEGQSGCTPAGPTDPEPAGTYTRTTHGGKTVNQRTKTMLQTAERYSSMLGGPASFSITQGSYNTGVAASAGTHDGGGVVDISSTSPIVLKALRMAGFAAWIRTAAEGFAPHIHAVAIGDTEVASGARSQIIDFFAGRNGLAGKGPDSAPASIGRPVPAWAGKYGQCT